MNRLHKVGALLAALITAVLLSAGFSSTATAAPPPAVNPAPIPVTGTPTIGGGTLAGTFDVQRFAAQNGQLTAVGTLVGTITGAGGTVTPVSQQVTLPVDLAQSTGSCQILDLVLGPVNLDLLGLVVHLDVVHLNITAVSGPGNLLGNLLCSVAHLLDGQAPVNALAALLNRLLGALG